MARQDTVIVSFQIDPATGLPPAAGISSLSDRQLAQGGVLGLGYVPHTLAQDKPDRRVGAIDAEYVTFTTDGANDVMVPHTLKRIPRRLQLVNGTAGVNIQIFRGATAWSDGRAYFRSNTTGDKVTVEIA